jgi:hypothetical protein
MIVNATPGSMLRGDRAGREDFSIKPDAPSAR